MTTEEARNWCYGSHLGALFVSWSSAGLGAFMVPLGIWMMKKDENEHVAQHAKAALNFQLTMLVLTFALIMFAIVTLGFGMLLVIPALILLLLLQIYAAVKACMQTGKDEPARYPFSFTFVK